MLKSILFSVEATDEWKHSTSNLSEKNKFRKSIKYYMFFTLSISHQHY